MSTKFYTTGQTARKIDVSRETLYSWIRSGLVKAPKPIHWGGASLGLWKEIDVAAAEAKGKLKRGPVPKKKKAGAK